MRYVEARIQEYTREEAYRIYITKSLQLAPQNKYITTSYSDLINEDKVKEKTGDEIVMQIFDKAGLRVK